MGCAQLTQTNDEAEHSPSWFFIPNRSLGLAWILDF